MKDIRDLAKNEVYVKDLVIAIIIIISLYLIGFLFWREILDFLIQVPAFRYIHEFVLQEIERKSVLGLSVITYIGGLFFLTYPGELMFFIYTNLGYSPLYVSLIMLLFTMLAQATNYGIGFFIEKKILHGFVKDRKRAFQSSLKKYDFVFIIIINILPLPSDLLTVILGMVKYDFKKAMLYTFIGKALKYIFLILLILVLRFAF